MSENIIKKEQYLAELAESAAATIAQGTSPKSMELMVPVWKDIIIKHMKPLLELIH